MADTPRLAIDLGTCHTVAVVRRKDNPPRALLFDGSPLLPSGVYASPDGQILVGRDAERMVQIDPARFEPYPKRQIDDTTVLLGDRELAVADLYTAILKRVAAEASTAGIDQTDGVVLTCPADWGPQRRAKLRAAAIRAGFARVELVDEPIAAATYCQSVLDQRIPAGKCVAVFDFGGGTLDVTVLRQDADELRVLAVGGLDDLGGIDCDEALAGHLHEAIGWRDAQVRTRLREPATPAEQHDRRAFRTEVRAAKEMLSRASLAPVRVPGLAEAIHLTREELERVVRPLIDRAVDETRRVLRQAGVATAGPEGGTVAGTAAAGELIGIFLVGGASRMPLVAGRLHARFRVAPTVPEQPELPVAYGALLVERATMATPAVPAGPAVPAAPAAGEGPTNPPSGWPTVFTPPPSGSPGAVSASWPVHSGTPTPTPTPTQTPTPAKVHLNRPPVQYPARANAGAGLRRFLVLLITLATIVPGYFLLKSAAGDLSHSASGSGQAGPESTDGSVGKGTGLRPVATVKLPTGQASAMTVTADTMYYALAGSDTTEVVAISVPEGKQRWKTTLRVASESMTMNVVGELLVVTANRVATNDNDAMRAVLDARTGTQRWLKSWADLLDLTYLGTDVLVQRRANARTSLERIDLGTGNVRWHRPPVSDSYPINDRISHAALVAPAAPDATGRPAANTDLDEAYPAPFGVDPTVAVELSASAKRITVVDPASGAAKASGATNLAADVWTVFNGFAIGRHEDENHSLLAYRLSDATRAWEYRLPAGSDFRAVRPCADRLVCAAVYTPSGSGYLVAVDIDSGTAKTWKHDSRAVAILHWNRVGELLLVGEGSPPSLDDLVLLDPLTGSRKSTLKDVYALATAGQNILTVRSTGDGWQATAIDGRTGKAIGTGDAGKEYPERAVIASSAFAVLTGDNVINLFSLPRQG